MSAIGELTRSIVALALPALVAIPADARPEAAKQLAGPVDDFALMRLPSPEALAAVSKRSIVAVDLEASKEWRHEIVTDAGSPFQLILLHAAGSGWDVELQRPDGVWIEADEGGPGAAWKRLSAAELGLGLPASPGLLAKSYENVGDGRWVVAIRSPGASLKGGDPRLERGVLIVQNTGPWSLGLWPGSSELAVGRTVPMRAAITHELDAESTLRIEEAVAEVIEPGGERFGWRLAGSDRVMKSSQDDQLRFDLSLAHPGLHRVSLRLLGRDPEGSLVERTVTVPIYAVDPPLGLAAARSPGEGRPAVLTLAEPSERTGRERLRIEVPVHRLGGEGARKGEAIRVRAYAELWGHTADLQPVPVAWVGGMKRVAGTDERAVLSLELDARWIARAGSQPPYELRELRLQDPDSSMPYAALDRLPLTSEAPTGLVKSAEVVAIEIDEEMRFGPRPAWLDLPAGMKVHPQETILLVHGYCSGDVWAAYESHFLPNVRRFRDFGRARSNDAFARRIRDTSFETHFSTVSHSQGGMASLHLFTHYWSGLDASDAPRRMQSVGTPYGGSVLMEDRIVLGWIVELLGVDLCDPVLDLTRLGAAFWLAGIPPAARDEVYYYRTRGQDLIPCFWSSPIIGGRDDGVVSVNEGRLSGAHDLGVTRKQCHTPGMTHKFQLSDRNRNWTMARNARIWLPDPLEACLNVTTTSEFAPATATLDATCSTVQSGSITSYRWDVSGAISRTLFGSRVNVPLPNTGLYNIRLTVTSTGPSLTDTQTTGVILSAPCPSPPCPIF